MLTATAELVTDRLRLRPLKIADAPAIYDTYASDADVTRYMTWRPHESVADAVQFVAGAIARFEGGDEFTYAITDRATGSLIGSVSATPTGHGVELGYVLARSRWGQGLMPEAIRAVRDWAAEDDEVFRVWAYCDVDNLASARALEKSGFDHEGRLRRWARHPNVSDEPRDAHAYSWAR